MAKADAPDDIDVDALVGALTARREELLALEAASADGRATVELDQTRVGRLSRMDAIQHKEMAMETGRRRKAELRRIAAAFARIEDGGFGWCLKCGEPVGRKRLELDPSTALCVACASAAA